MDNHGHGLRNGIPDFNRHLKVKLARDYVTLIGSDLGRTPRVDILVVNAFSRAISLLFSSSSSTPSQDLHLYSVKSAASL
jgi:hypothetical protein